MVFFMMFLVVFDHGLVSLFAIVFVLLEYLLKQILVYFLFVGVNLMDSFLLYFLLFHFLLFLSLNRANYVLENGCAQVENVQIILLRGITLLLLPYDQVQLLFFQRV